MHASSFTIHTKLDKAEKEEKTALLATISSFFCISIFFSFSLILTQQIIIDFILYPQIKINVAVNHVTIIFMQHTCTLNKSFIVFHFSQLHNAYQSFLIGFITSLHFTRLSKKAFHTELQVSHLFLHWYNFLVCVLINVLPSHMAHISSNSPLSCYRWLINFVISLETNSTHTLSLSLGLKLFFHSYHNFHFDCNQSCLTLD